MKERTVYIILIAVTIWLCIVSEKGVTVNHNLLINGKNPMREIKK